MEPNAAKTTPSQIDFTELKRRVAELEEREERLQSENKYLRELYDRSPLGYQSLDENGCFIEVNQAWLNSLGYTREEVIGKNFGDFLHPDWRNHFKNNFPRFKAVGEILGVEFEIAKKGGEYVHVSFHGKVGRDSKGRFQQTYCIFQDITRQRAAEEALIHSEEKWRNIIVNTPQIGICLDPLGKIVFANRHFLQLVDRQEKEVVGSDWFEMFIPEHRRMEIRRVFEKVMGKMDVVGFSNYENEIITRNGAVRNVAWSNALSKDISGNIIDVTCLGVDLTEQKRAMTAIKESEERHRTYIDNTPYGVFVIDEEEHCCQVNPSACRITGYSGEELLSMTMADLMVEDNRQEYQRYFAILKCKETLTGDFQYRHRNGQQRWWTLTAVKISDRRFLGFCNDITDRKDAEAKLIASEERHRNIIRTAMDGFWMVDGNGRILEVNAAYCQMSGYSEQKLLTMTIADLEENETAGDIKNHLRRIAAAGEERFETKHRRRDKTVIELEVSVQHSPTDKDIFFVFLHDISKRKQQEVEQQKLQEQLLQAQKMEAIGRLAGGVAHDFNNMLGVILGHTEMALEVLAPAQPLYIDLVEIQKATERSVNLTRQLLAFARKQTIAPKVLDFNDAVAGMLRMVQRLIGEDIDLVWLPAADLWPIKMDPSQLDQILANLCINARDAIAGVGKVTIETDTITFDAEYCKKHPGYIAGDYVLLALSDDGCGMEKETMAQLFEPFFTTKETGKGTGLGLATVYGIVKQNNGFINVYSEPAAGTTFRIYFPRHRTTTGPAAEKAIVQPAPCGDETILLVEDEPAILAMTCTMLERLGYTVLAAASPGEAISLAGEYPGKISLVLTDVVMPEMNGRDLVRQLLALYPDLRSLFMSGYTANVIAHHGVLDAGVQFIEKPFSKRNLATKIKQVLQQDLR